MLSALQVRFVQLIAFVVGASSLGAEIAGARLLAPYFGASTIVWANTIATVLVALSVGYWLGGRIADRAPSLRGLCVVVLIAAGLLALIPLISSPLLRAAISALASVSAGAFIGSLLGVLALLSVPIVLLGTVAPYAVRLTVRSVEESGRITGRLYAISTVGSLAGTFLSALLLVPLVGTKRTFLIFSLSLAIVAVAGLRKRYLLAPLAVAALIALPSGTVKTVDGSRVIYERETAYQYVRVIENTEGERTLELNEGQAVHSKYRPGEFLTGDYWDEMLVLPLAGKLGIPSDIAILGNAAGTTARAYGHYFPATRVDGVEIDGELTSIGRRYFDLGGPHLRTYEADARPFLRERSHRYEALIVDAYRQPYIPFYLTTREFFELCRERLRSGGVLMVNVGHPENTNQLERVLTRTLKEIFPHVMRDPVKPTNTVLVASTAALKPEQLKAAAPSDLNTLAGATSKRLQQPLNGGDVYTDDKAPVEWLIDRSIIEYAAQ